jgi:JmjC domain
MRLDGRILEVDPDDFAEGFSRRSVEVRHSLVGHPLLTLDAIADLADAMPLTSVERHRADLPAVLPGGAPELVGPPSQTVREIEGNNCWMVLWYIDQMPEYKALLDECLDEVESYLPGGERGMRQREAFLFLSAPDAVTPIHFDPEHNLLLQVKGHKDMNVCPFADRDSEQRELGRYFSGGHRNLEAIPSDGTTYPLDPGEGVYVPSFVPHWVKNGDEASISLSITFRTPRSRRAERVNTVNAHLRRVGLSPQPEGSSPGTDRAKELAYQAFFGWQSRLGRLRRTLRGRHTQRHQGGASS